MLQQTQVDRVIPKYREFLKQFPTARALAHAKRSDVVRAWAGLGYNRRAVNVHRAAQIILSNHRGRTPIVLEEFKCLPGVGDYTARAVLAFARNAPYAPVDTNIRRILIRHFGIAEKEVVSFAQKILPRNRVSDWSQMLMDFGALVCTSRNPQCHTLGLHHIAEPSRPRYSSRPFVDSDRFWRGRIISVFRTGAQSLSEKQLLAELSTQQKLSISQKRIAQIIVALERDGLLKRKSRACLVLG